MINTNWIFGQNAGIDFNSGVNNYSVPNFNAKNACASCSDASGQLLFYSNNFEVFNNQNNIIGNITGWQQPISNIALFQRPYSCDSYIKVSPDRFPIWGLADRWGNNYPYHNEPGSTADTNSIHLNQINTDSQNVLYLGSLDSPSGFRFTEKVIAVRKNNGQDMWIICFMRKFNNTLSTDPQGSPYGIHNELGIMRVYEFTHLGISQPQDIPLQHPINPWGQININLQNSKIAINNWIFKTTTVIEFHEANNQSNHYR